MICIFRCKCTVIEVLNAIQLLYFFTNKSCCVVNVTNIEQGARLETFIKSLKMSKKEFAVKIGVTPGQVSHVATGRNSISAELAKSIAIAFPELSWDWVFVGRGEMLKHSYTSPDESPREEIAPTTTFFNRNLPVLLRAFEMDSNNLSSIIAEQSSITLNDLVNGNRGPSLQLLIRLRELWGIPIDDMLFTDLTYPGTMDDLKEKAGENLQIKQTLEKVLEKLEDLDKRDQEKQKAIERLKKTLDGPQQE